MMCETLAKYMYLPREIPLKHIDEIKWLTKKAVTVVDKSIAHFDRTKRIRTIEFEEADKIIFQLVEILYFYSVLLGAGVACDTNNLTIQYDWKSIFNQAWKS